VCSAALTCGKASPFRTTGGGAAGRGRLDRGQFGQARAAPAPGRIRQLTDSALHDAEKPQTLGSRSALPFGRSRPLEDFGNLGDKARSLLDLWVTFCFHFLTGGKAGNQIEQFDLDS